MSILFTNNAATTLASGITNVATSLTVAAGKGALFPTISGSDFFYATLANGSGGVEIVKVTARSTDTFTIVRGQDGTSGVAWNTGDKVELRVTAADLTAMVQSANLQVGGTATTGTAGSSTYLRGDGAWSTPVTSNVAGTGISVSGATGAVTVTNTGVTSNVAGTGISVSGATGAVTVTNSGVTSVTAGTGISVSASTGGVTITNTAPSASVDVQTFNSTATWTKPSGGQKMARIQVWGGGGGAGKAGGAGAASGGGGGGYNEITVPTSYLSATVTATVGGGGAGGVGTNGNGSVGGTSTFALATAFNGVSTLAAYGGGGGSFLSGCCGGAAGGAGGGQISAGGTANYLPGRPRVAQGAYTAAQTALTGAHWQGGAGGWGSVGSDSLFGGGGGSGYTGGGGTSVFGGNGGNVGTAGTQPGGGGGAWNSAAAAVAGGAGRVVVTCW